MPCEQCENGKWRWGKTGECKYDTQAECEDDNQEKEPNVDMGKDKDKKKIDKMKSLNIGLPHLATMVFDSPLMIAKHKFDTILSVLKDRMSIDMQSMESNIFNPMDHQMVSSEGGIAIIPVHGSLTNRAMGINALSGMSSYAEIGEQFKDAVEDNSVNEIVFDIDSPGGQANGVFDLVDTIFNARGKKPITAIVNESAFSAAYAIASAADKIYMPRTAGVGSIGVIAAHVDQSERDKNDGIKVTAIFAGDRKNDLSPHEPLSDVARDNLQSQVNNCYQLFVETVARNRGLSVKQVIDTQAHMFIGKTAIVSGLADEIISIDDAMMKISSNVMKGNMSMSNEETKVELEASTETETGVSESAEIVDFDKKLAEAKDAAAAKAKQDAAIRAKEIVDICETAKMQQLAGELIAGGLDVEGVRKEVFNKLAAKSEQLSVSSSFAVGDKVEAENFGWGDAFAKVGPTVKK